MTVVRGIVLLGLVAAFLPVHPASAQSTRTREVGVHASVLRPSDFSTNVGLGGRVSFDVAGWVAFEAEVNYFPRDRFAGPESLTSVGGFRVARTRTRFDALAGLKLGVKGDRLGAFAKLRPGLTRLSDRGTECVGPGCAVVLMLIGQAQYRTEFAFDLGAGVEFYPSARTVARVEVGDTMIRDRSTLRSCAASSCTTHNFSSRLGMGVRF